MTVITLTLNPSIDKTFSVDRMIPDRKLVGTDVRDYPGGGGVNVARVLSRFDVPVLAYWSDGGNIGQRLGKLLDAEKVSHEPVPVADDVRENYIILDKSTENLYRFGMPGPTLSEKERDRWMKTVREIPASSQYVVFSGSLPGGASLDWFEELLRAVPKGPRIIVDSKKEDLRRALEVGVYLIKPNMHELEEMVGQEITCDAEVEQACHDIIGKGGAEVVVVSLGPAGALLVTADAVERFSAPAVRLESPVGAGDSMVGGMVAALAEGRSLSDAVKFGVAAGAATAMTEGTELCHREGVERLYSGVRRQETAR